MLRINDPETSAAWLEHLHAWRFVLEVTVLLPVSMLVAGTYSMRRQVYAQEADLQEMQQGLGRKTEGLEQCIRERTAELSTEIAERRRADQLNRGRNHVLELLATSGDMMDTLNALLATITGQSTTLGGAIHQTQADKLVLCTAAGISEMLMGHLREIDVNFVHASEASSLQSGAFSAMEATVLTRTLWSQLLAANGIHATWSLPIWSAEGYAIGVLTIYSRLRAQPASRHRELLEMACAMAGLIFEHHRLQTKLLLFAYHDPLTGLPNRRFGEDRLDLAISSSKDHGKEVAVLWFDVNHFKEINDVHGHPIGDLVLQEIANRLSKGVRGTDTVARMGGDEFMVVLHERVNRAAAERIAVELHDMIATPMRIGGLELSITASVGISPYPADGDTAEELKQNADQAMYQANPSRRAHAHFLRHWPSRLPGCAS